MEQTIDLTKCYGIEKKPFSKLSKEGKLFHALVFGSKVLTPASANAVANTTDGTRFLRWIREDHGHFIQKKHRNADNTGTYFSYELEPDYAAAVRDACRAAARQYSETAC